MSRVYGFFMEPPIPSVEGLVCQKCGDEAFTNAFIHCILHKTATKMLLAIIRDKWPMGTFTFKKAPETFWPSVISEFQKSYYSYHPGVSDADDDAVVKVHVARTMTQTLYEEEWPRYFDEDVWRSFCSHWCKASFKNKSDINANNRKKLQVVHTTGAKPFNKFKQLQLTTLQSSVMAWQRNHQAHARHDGVQDPPAKRRRSHSKGEYGNPPTVPRPIKVSSTHILDKTATKTLLAIMRANWPMETYTLKMAPETFWPSVITEFRRYYSYHSGISDTDGDAVVKLHVARTMTQTLYEEKNRATTRTEQNNTSLQEECPAYFNADVWRSFCSHWCKASFKNKSDINAKNREKLQVVHTTGAKPFNKFKEDLKQRYGEPPTTVEFWDESHKKKDTDEWASVKAQSIGNRMREILASIQAAGESSQNRRSGISALIEAH